MAATAPIEVPVQLRAQVDEDLRIITDYVGQHLRITLERRVASNPTVLESVAELLVEPGCTVHIGKNGVRIIDHEPTRRTIAEEGD